MSIPLTLTVLVIILEAAMLCCRLACMNEMVLTITCLASSSSFSSYFLPSGLVPRREKTAYPTPLKGVYPHPLQCGDGSCVNIEHKANPVGFLHALIHSPVPSVKTLVQPIEPQEVPLHVLQGARKPLYMFSTSSILLNWR